MEQRLRRLDERAAKQRQIVRAVMLENDIKKIIDPELRFHFGSGQPPWSSSMRGPIIAAQAD